VTASFAEGTIQSSDEDCVATGFASAALSEVAPPASGEPTESRSSADVDWPASGDDGTKAEVGLRLTVGSGLDGVLGDALGLVGKPNPDPGPDPEPDEEPPRSISECNTPLASMATSAK